MASQAPCRTGARASSIPEADRSGLRPPSCLDPRPRDLQARAQFPGWDSSANGASDSIFARMQGPAATAANRWVGDRGGYEDPQMLDLITKYRTSLSEADQAQSMKNISDFMVSQLPLLVLYFLPEQVGVRTGIQALDRPLVPEVSWPTSVLPYPGRPGLDRPGGIMRARVLAIVVSLDAPADL